LLKQWFPQQKEENFMNNFTWDFSNREIGFHFLLEYNKETIDNLSSEDNNQEPSLFKTIWSYVENIEEKVFNKIINTRYGNLIFFNPKELKYDIIYYLTAPSKELNHVRLDFNIKTKEQEKSFFSILKKAYYIDSRCCISYQDRFIIEELIKFTSEKDKQSFKELILENDKQILLLDWWK